MTPVSDLPGVVVIGAGGHAKVVIELLRANGEDVAFSIAAEGYEESTCLEVPVLIGDHQIRSLWEVGHRHAIVAIGDNSLREALSKKARTTGFTFVNAVSPSATVSPTAKLGVGVVIMAGAVVNAAADVGDHSIVNTLASVDHDSLIGALVHIAPNCAIAGNVRIGNKAFVGIGSTILPNITVGPGAMIGAGSVVTKDVLTGTVAGVPARPLFSNSAN